MTRRKDCKVGKKPVGVIEVDSGFHETPEQAERDALKNAILAKSGIPILRLSLSGRTQSWARHKALARTIDVSFGPAHRFHAVSMQFRFIHWMWQEIDMMVYGEGVRYRRGG